MTTVAPARTDDEVAQVRDLFRAYIAELDLDPVVPGWQAELAGLPGRYAAPAGALFLARAASGEPAGCAAVRPVDLPGACELKRLYVRRTVRASGIGRALVTAAVEFAATAGYARMLLDTGPDMAAAHALYRALGFTEVPPYQDAAMPGMRFFAKRLQ